MKLFPAKCHERETLRKLWRQMGNSSLLTAVARNGLNLSAVFSNFAFVLFCYITNHLMTGPLGNSEFCFPWISMFPSTSSWETLRFSGNKIHCSPRYSWFCHPILCDFETQVFRMIRVMWSLYEIIHICTAVVDESEEWSFGHLDIWTRKNEIPQTFPDERSR